MGRIPAPGHNTYRLFAAALLLASAAAIPLQAEDEVQQTKILVIHSYHPSFEWTRSQQEGITDTIDAGDHGFRLSVEYMDTKRVSDPGHIPALATLYQAKYRENPPDVVISTDNNAFRLLYDKRQDIFGREIPVVFSGVNFFQKEDWPGMSNISGVDERPDLDATIELIDNLADSPGRILIVTDDTVTGNIYRQSCLSWLSGRTDRERFVFVDPADPDRIVDEVRRLPGDAAVYYLTYARDSEGNTYQPEELLVRLAEETDARIFGNYTFMMDRGIIGGPVISGYDQGAAAAAMALEILDGTVDPAVFRLETGSFSFEFDYRFMKKAGIRMNDLPGDSQVINMPESLWVRYPVESAIVITLLLGLSVALGFMFYLLSMRNRLLRQIGRMNSELEERVKERSDQLSRAENELMRSEKLATLGSLVAGIAHEINTPLGLSLTGAGFLQDRFSDFIAGYEKNEMDTDRFREFLDTGREMSAMIESNLKRAGSQMANFRQVAVDQTGELPRSFVFADILDDFLLSMKSELKKHRIRTEVECPDDLMILHYPGDLWRVLANLLMNSLKHAYAKGEEGTVGIRVSLRNEMLELVYSDDGRGIPEENISKVFLPYFTTARENGGTGLGMHLIRSIVEDRHGGSVSVRNRSPRGVVFTVSFPVASPAMKNLEQENGS